MDSSPSAALASSRWLVALGLFGAGTAFNACSTSNPASSASTAAGASNAGSPSAGSAGNAASGSGGLSAGSAGSAALGSGGASTAGSANAGAAGLDPSGAGAAGGGSTPPDPVPKTPPFGWVGVIGTGQSLAVGGGGSPEQLPISKAASAKNLKLSDTGADPKYPIQPNTGSPKWAAIPLKEPFRDNVAGTGPGYVDGQYPNDVQGADPGAQKVHVGYALTQDGGRLRAAHRRRSAE